MTFWGSLCAKSTVKAKVCRRLDCNLLVLCLIHHPLTHTGVPDGMGPSTLLSVCPRCGFSGFRVSFSCFLRRSWGAYHATHAYKGTRCGKHAVLDHSNKGVQLFAAVKMLSIRTANAVIMVVRCCCGKKTHVTSRIPNSAFITRVACFSPDREAVASRRSCSRQERRAFSALAARVK